MTLPPPQDVRLLDAPVAGVRVRVLWHPPGDGTVAQPLSDGWEFRPEDSPGWEFASRDTLGYRGGRPDGLLPVTLRVSAHRPDDLEPLPGVQLLGAGGSVLDEADPIDAPSLQVPAMRIGVPAAPADGSIAIGLLNVSDHPIRKVGLAVEGLVLPVTIDDLPPWAPKTVTIAAARPAVVRVVQALNANGVEMPRSLLPPPLPVDEDGTTTPMPVDPSPDVVVRPDPVPAGVVGGRVTLTATATATRSTGPVHVVAALPLHLTPIDSRWTAVPGGATTVLDSMAAGEARRLELVCHVLASGSGAATFAVSRPAAPTRP